MIAIELPARKASGVMRKASRLWKMSFIFILSIPAHADVTVTRRLQTEGILGISSLVESVTWRSGDKEREEIKDSSETGQKEDLGGPKITALLS